MSVMTSMRSVVEPGAKTHSDSHAKSATLRAIQLGMGWFSEQPGGLDRYYAELLRFLPGAGVACRGLVLGSKAVERESNGAVRAVAESKTPLLHRWKQIRAFVGR